MLLQRSERVSIENVQLDGTDYPIFHLRLFAGTKNEVVVSAADYYLEDKIERMILQNRYHECRQIDERFDIHLTPQIDTNSDAELIEFVENVYGKPIVILFCEKKKLASQ